MHFIKDRIRKIFAPNNKENTSIKCNLVHFQANFVCNIVKFQFGKLDSFKFLLSTVKFSTKLLYVCYTIMVREKLRQIMIKYSCIN